MIRIREAIVVEGRYDQIRLASLFDATVIVVDGFRIFKDKEMLALLRTLAHKTGVVILTDSDAAGFKIRHFLKGALTGDVKHAYIGDVYGKEKRKAAPSKEGKLGVEGMTDDMLLAAMRRAGVALSDDGPAAPRNGITKAMLYADGLYGRPDADARRAALKHKLGLPELLSTSSLVVVLNTLMTPDEYNELIGTL